MYGEDVITTADKLEKPPKTVVREMFQNAFTDIKGYFEPLALEQGISQNNLSSIGCSYVATKPSDS